MHQSSSRDYVDAVHKFSSHGFNKKYHDEPPKRDSSKYQTDFINKCKYCSYSHKRGACPAYAQMCNNSNRKGHYSMCCTNKKRKAKKIKIHKRSDVTSTGSETDVKFDHFFIGCVSDDDLISFGVDWCIDLKTKGTIINYKIDSGAEANILPLKQYRKLVKQPKLNSPKCKLSAYNGTDIPVKGSCILYIFIKILQFKFYS